VPATREGGLSRAVWPDVNRTDPNQAAMMAVNEQGIEYATWPPGMVPQVTGRVYAGLPPSGSFVNPDDVGVNYVSPGYQ
jgi:hypothetical protein